MAIGELYYCVPMSLQFWCLSYGGIHQYVDRYIDNMLNSFLKKPVIYCNYCAFLS